MKILIASNTERELYELQMCYIISVSLLGVISLISGQNTQVAVFHQEQLESCGKGLHPAVDLDRPVMMSGNHCTCTPACCMHCLGTFGTRSCALWRAGVACLFGACLCIEQHARWRLHGRAAGCVVDYLTCGGGKNCSGSGRCFCLFFPMFCVNIVYL